MKSKVALREAVFGKDTCCVAILEQSDFSKAKRKKKEESETLPQVSEDIDSDIAADLKDLFGPSKKKQKKPEEIPWDKDDEQDSAPADHLGPLPGNDVTQESSAFTFPSLETRRSRA